MIRIVFALLTAAASLAPLAAQAQQDFPNQPVHVIVGYPPGSTADLSARVLGARMGQILGQQIVVENRVGAGSSLAAGQVARAPKGIGRAHV